MRCKIGSIGEFSLAEDGSGLCFGRDGRRFGLVSDGARAPVCEETETRFVFHWEERLRHLTRQRVILTLRPLVHCTDAKHDVHVQTEASLLWKTWGQDSALVVKPEWLGGLICLPRTETDPDLPWFAARPFHPGHLEHAAESDQAQRFLNAYVRTELDRLLMCVPRR